VIKKTILTIVVFSLNLNLFSQTIDYETNVPRDGDSMSRQILEFYSEGNEGQNVVWDFSSLSKVSDSDEDVYVEYYIDPDSSRLSVVDGNVISRFSVFADSLQIAGRETILEWIQYDVPQTIMAYPFEYGNSISGSYDGHGTYSSSLNVSVTGNLRIESDAEGIIITDELDTLYNVLRVHTLRTGSVSMHHVTGAELSDSSHMKQEIEERFEWYVRGFRYPLYETTSVTYYDDMKMVYSTQTASRISPSDMYLPDDSVNDSILAYDASIRDRMQSSEATPSSDQTANDKADILHYTFSIDGRTILFNYDLDSDAILTCIICNKMGMLTVNRREHVKAGTDYMMEFDISSFTPNDYIFYINVNGKVYSEIFKVR
jgi:hypothetical protein